MERMAGDADPRADAGALVRAQRHVAGAAGGVEDELDFVAAFALKVGQQFVQHGARAVRGA